MCRLWVDIPCDCELNLVGIFDYLTGIIFLRNIIFYSSFPKLQLKAENYTLTFCCLKQGKVWKQLSVVYSFGAYIQQDTFLIVGNLPHLRFRINVMLHRESQRKVALELLFLQQTYCWSRLSYLKRVTWINVFTGAFVKFLIFYHNT